MKVCPKICVIGGSGMLGSRLIPYLRERGYRVFCFSRKDRDGDDSIQIDTASDNSLEQALDACQPSIIINSAALTDVDLCEQYPHKAYISNVSVVEKLSHWIKDNRGCHLIQISTDHNYDGNGPHTESNIKIINHYGFSKYAGEIAALSVNATVLRTNFFGKSLCPGRQSFSDWSFYALKHGKNLSLYEDVFFSPLSMLSLSKCIERVISKPLSGIFNVGSHKGFSKADFVFKLADIFNFDNVNLSKVLYKEQGFSTPRPFDMRMDSTKFELAFYPDGLPTLEEEIYGIAGEYFNECG